MSLAQENLEVAQGATVGMDFGVIGNVVAVIAQRRRIKRQQPQAGHAQSLQIVELGRQAGKIADPVAVAVVKGADP